MAYCDASADASSDYVVVPKRHDDPLSLTNKGNYFEQCSASFFLKF